MLPHHARSTVKLYCLSIDSTENIVKIVVTGRELQWVTPLSTGI